MKTKLYENLFGIAFLQQIAEYLMSEPKTDVFVQKAPFSIMSNVLILLLVILSLTKFKENRCRLKNNIFFPLVSDGGIRP